MLSLKVALWCVAAVTVPGIALGWLLARRNFAGKNVLNALVHAPLVLPPVVIGYLALLTLGRQGPVGRWLDAMGVHLAFTWQGAVVAAAIMAMPLMVRAVRLAIELADTRLEQAAATLGASPLRVFATVTLPLAMPGVVSGLVLAFARALGEFGATITFVGNIEGQTRTLPLAIYSLISCPGGESSAMTLVLASLGLSLGALLVSEALAGRLRRRVAVT
jgi:molybdate transport system permease protein